MTHRHRRSISAALIAAEAAIRTTGLAWLKRFQGLPTTLSAAQTLKPAAAIEARRWHARPNDRDLFERVRNAAGALR